jgi:hypothetical protein
MNCKVEVVAHSIGPNNKEICTLLLEYGRPLHPEHIRHRTQSFSVASSRALKKSSIKQVKENPWIPLYFPKSHSGMQSKEVWEPGSTDAKLAEEQWLVARDKAVYHAEQLEAQGVSNQIYNRLIEPWVTTRCVCTATEWDGFFKLRKPDGNEIDLNFPAEYNIQQLALCIRAAIEASTPKQLRSHEWHLPFADDPQTEQEVIDLGYPKDDLSINDALRRVSMARTARTSYGKNLGKTVKDDLELAEMLMSSQHWSPAEHQAMATGYSQEDIEDIALGNMKLQHDGLELRMFKNKPPELWSRNFHGGWLQSRALLDS